MKIFSKKKVLTGILVLISVVCLLNLFSKEVRGFFYSISMPIQKIFWRAGERVLDFFEIFGRTKKLKKDVENLKFENQALLFQIAVLKELENENKILREALEIGLEKEFKLILVQIIGKDISQDFILIDKGEKDGILEGMPVITQQKVLFGRVSEVYENFSKVMLISSKKSSFDVKILDKDISGVIKGKGNFKIFLDLIPQDKEILNGDTVISSSMGGIFPSGLLVGRIKEIKKSDVEPFQKAEIELFFDISQTETLFVIQDF